VGDARLGGARGGAVSEALRVLMDDVTRCRACPRLVAWREAVAREKRASFRDQEYWGRPVPGFGDPAARLLVLGLAPAAHGANRTGRIFTGDRSGDFLYAALFRAGFASQPTSVHRGDGLALRDCWVTSAVKCAPPANKPLPAERDACAAWFHGERALLPRVRVILCLGGFAWDAAIRLLRGEGIALPVPMVRFGHGAVARVPGAPVLLGAYHPSQQNTFTGRLTEGMMDEVLAVARGLVSEEG
jgi:uracil-DNA glycosylase family 4